MEQVSTLMDGELDIDEAAREIARVKQDAARRDSWDTYHAIGDAIRGERVMTRDMSADFVRRLSQRLALEPTVVAPRPRLPKTLQTWALSAAASVAAIAAVGWMANTLNPDAVPGTLAQAPSAKPPAVLQAPAAPVPAQALVPLHVHEYLLAHQGISPTTAIQGVTPYIRTVSNVGNRPGQR